VTSVAPSDATLTLLLKALTLRLHYQPQRNWAKFAGTTTRAREKKIAGTITSENEQKETPEIANSKDLFSSDLIEQHQLVHSIPPTHSFDWRIEVKLIVVDSRRSLSIFESFFRGFHMNMRERLS
jgi:hypothetical protein